MLRLKDHELKANTLRDLIRVQSELGDKTAIVMDDEEISFIGIHLLANQVANNLLSMGLRKGDVVATYMFNSIDHIAVWFACAKIGAIWAPVNIALVNVDLAYTLQKVEPKALFIDDRLVENYQKIRPELDIDTVIVRGERVDPSLVSFDTFKTGSDEEPEAIVLWDDPAGIIFTGGSTGMPKGVLVANFWYFPGVGRYKELYNITPDDVHVGLGQLYHTIGSAVDVICPFYYGIKTIMSHWFSATKFWPSVAKHRGSVSMMVGPIMLALLARPAADDDSDNTLRLITTATGGVPRETVHRFAERFGVDFLEIYGQTETGPACCVGQRVDDRPYHSLGKAHGWAEIMVADPAGNRCPPGQVGEFLMRPNFPNTFMIGYYNNIEKYVETTRDLWFHTGDLGYQDSEGYLHYHGRVAHTIRSRGENIAAIEVESIILRHAQVLRVGVVGVPSASTGDEDVAAFVVTKPGETLDPLDLVKHCEINAAYFKVPRFITIVDALPTSATKNEIERHRLKELGVAKAWDRETSDYKISRRR